MLVIMALRFFIRPPNRADVVHCILAAFAAGSGPNKNPLVLADGAVTRCFVCGCVQSVRSRQLALEGLFLAADIVFVASAGLVEIAVASAIGKQTVDLGRGRSFFVRFEPNRPSPQHARSCRGAENECATVAFEHPQLEAVLMRSEQVGQPCRGLDRCIAPAQTYRGRCLDLGKQQRQGALRAVGRQHDACAIHAPRLVVVGTRRGCGPAHFRPKDLQDRSPKREFDSDTLVGPDLNFLDALNERVPGERRRQILRQFNRVKRKRFW